MRRSENFVNVMVKEVNNSVVHFSIPRGVKTLSADTRKDHVRTYGIWAWLIGFAFGGAITYFMFAVADGFA